MTDAATYHRGQRNFGTGYDMIDQIEALEAKLTKVVEALPRWILAMGDWDQGGEQAIEEMTATLAEIKGESHD